MTTGGTAGEGGINGEMSNSKFGLLCRESRFGFWGMVAIVVLQVLMGAFAVGELAGFRRTGAVERAGEEKGVEMEIGGFGGRWEGGV